MSEGEKIEQMGSRRSVDRVRLKKLGFRGADVPHVAGLPAALAAPRVRLALPEEARCVRGLVVGLRRGLDRALARRPRIQRGDALDVLLERHFRAVEKRLSEQEREIGQIR
jgi:hypothetical protein